MKEKEQYLESISEIRSIMERSSKFLSLSGLSGIAAGITATIAGGIVYFNPNFGIADISNSLLFNTMLPINKIINNLIIAVITFIVAITLAYYFTRRNAKSKKMAIWDKTAKLLTIELAVPLIVGGIFVMIQLFYFKIITLAAPTMLIFYGLALFSASKYTVSDTRWLGIAEILLGIFALIFFGYGLLYWIIGFGLFHIVYGTVLYFKYDKQK